MKCSNCGKEIAQGAKFCTSCGAVQQAAPQPVPQPAPQPEKKKKSHVKAIIAIVLVVAVIAGATAAGFLWVYPTFFKDKYLKNMIQKKAGKEIIEYWFDDFNGDGEEEAFAVAGKGDKDGFSKGEIWFASDKAVCKSVKKNFDGKVNGILEEDKDKYISVEAEKDGESRSYIYGVKSKNKYFEPEISGVFSEVRQKGDKIVTADGEEVSIKDFSLEEYEEEQRAKEEAEYDANEDIDALVPAEVKVGVICLHDENLTSDNLYIEAAKVACNELGVELEFKKNVSEASGDCYDAAEELIESGCNLIVAGSFGYESDLIMAAEDYSDIQFFNPTGIMAHTENLSNYHNAYASVHEGRYLTGVAAGLKLNELKDAGKLKGSAPKLGFVGSFTYAEVISAYTAFYLGAKSVCPDVTMDVTFTKSWYDITAEKQAAQELIKDKCDIISQYSDSMGAPTACEEAGVPNVAYNINAEAQCPNTFIMSSGIDWTPYFRYIIDCTQNGEDIDTDWTGTLDDGAVVISEINENAAARDTEAEIDEVMEGLSDGSVNVFDTSEFTVKGKELDSYKADVDYDFSYTPDTEAIEDGYFHESEYRSSPYFDVRIDGITLLNEAF